LSGRRPGDDGEDQEEFAVGLRHRYGELAAPDRPGPAGRATDPVCCPASRPNG
jgi:hypothetical protein